MTSVQYTGHFPATYPDYVDAATGQTLVAEPGVTYDVRAAPGRNPGLSPVPGDGRWSAPAVPAEQAPEDPPEDLADEPPAAPEDPPAAPEPAPAGSADDSETETTPAAPEGASASTESED